MLHVLAIIEGHHLSTVNARTRAIKIVFDSVLHTLNPTYDQQRLSLQTCPNIEYTKLND